MEVTHLPLLGHFWSHGLPHHKNQELSPYHVPEQLRADMFGEKHKFYQKGNRKNGNLTIRQLKCMNIIAIILF